jgi:hemolysin activation/secretion protein
MGLGGRYFLRGYDYREYSGDKGIAGSAELRFDLKQHIGPVENTQLYVFADAGSVGNYEDGFGSGSLASAGVGARLDLGKKFELGLELGIPLRDGAIADKDYSPRFSFTLAARF